MQENASSLYRLLPSMNILLQQFERNTGDAVLDRDFQERAVRLAASLPRPMLRESIEAFLDSCRAAIAEGRLTDAASLQLPTLMPQILRFVEKHSQPHFRKVLNATGVIIHTNLGRSLLADEAVDAIGRAAASYSNLEFDLATGERGSRYSHVEKLICRLTGAEAALVVNNNAAAVLLMLDTLCKGREVVVSRGELVEIGGSFRIPEVMEKSGCALKEVGATNRTHAKDYQAAINENTAALMKVHTSNFRIIGFTKSVDRRELSELAHEHGLPLLEDLGSGTLVDFVAAGQAGLSGEPTAAQIIESGIDVATFSGDKLLGGPQAGIIAGRQAYIERIKKNPLNRALRIDKLTLAALEATLRLYTDPEKAMERIPTLRMILMPESELHTRANKLARMTRRRMAETKCDCEISLRTGASRTGGGAFPENDLPTRLVCLSSQSLAPDLARERLLRAEPPLVARVEDNALCLDPRTLDPKEFHLVADALAWAYSQAHSPADCQHYEILVL